MAEERVATLVTTKPEAEIAADLKARFEKAMEGPIDVMNEARAHGMAIQFNVMPGGPFMKFVLQNFCVVKQY